MANNRFVKKIFVNPAHLPTLMLVVGYFVYWAELYLIRTGGGHTSALATFCFALWGLSCLFYHKSSVYSTFQEFKVNFFKQDRYVKVFICFGGGIALLILSCAFYASLFPPHLIQETDALNYHITLPRQHLILGSFQHIPWSLADLYFLPVDFALAPYWLVTEFPNKFPQFLFLIGFVIVASRLTKRFSQNSFISICLIILAIIGSHNVGIQMGTAMLDIAMCYLLLAALDSFLEGNLWLCAAEFTFYFWSKSFIPIQTILIVLFMLIIYGAARKFGFKQIAWSAENTFSEEEKNTYGKSLKKALAYFILLSVFIGGPFVGKSLYYAQTPLFPFLVGAVPINDHIDKSSVAWKSLVEKAEKAVSTRDQYGSGRSPIQLIKHFWLIAVPEKGVNNRYDYPVGLVYLLCLGPFIYILFRTSKNKRFAVLPYFVCICWSLWWMGSHQSRFLLAPIVLMFIVVLSQPKYCSKILMACIVLALLSTMLSIIRAHRDDFGKPAREVLRPKDRILLEASRTIQEDGPVTLNFADAAFADFAVEAKNYDSVFVLRY